MNDILNKLHEAAASPRAQMDGYLAQGKKIVLCAPVYTPEELIHAMGFVPMGAWGGDVALNRAKEYCPAFLCAIVQSLLELGISGAYEGASAIVIPSLCDTLKTVGENWKYAVPSIPFIPMTYPQNRKPVYGVAYTKAGYERVIRDLEKLGGAFSEEKLLASIKIYNRHNAAMRKIDELLAVHPEITAAQRSDIFKSAFFMTKEEHTDQEKVTLDIFIKGCCSGNTKGTLEDLLSAGFQMKTCRTGCNVNTLVIHTNVKHVDQVLDDLTKGEGYDSEVVALEAQYRHADDNTRNRRKQSGNDHGDSQTQRCKRNRIRQTGGGDNARKRADRHKARMAERQLTEDADGQVERDRHDNIRADGHEQTLDLAGDAAACDGSLHDDVRNDDNAEAQQRVTSALGRSIGF